MEKISESLSDDLVIFHEPSVHGKTPLTRPFTSNLVGLSGYFSNLHVEMKYLVRGLFSAMGSSDRVSGRAEIVDLRGPVA